MDSIGYILLIDGSAYKPMYEFMVSDVNSCENVLIVSDAINNGRLKKLLTKGKIQLFTKGVFDWVAYDENNLYKAIRSIECKYDKIVVVFTNSALAYNPYLIGTLKRYKNNYKNLYYVLYYLDIMGVNVSKNADFLRTNGVFDLVYTIDRKDATRTKSILWRTCYSENKIFKKIKPKNDLYFCGVSKGRTAILAALSKYADENNLDYYMDIICEEDTVKELYQNSRIHTHDRCGHLPYPEILRKELEAKCILDIVQKNQSALSLRPYEAIVYNRKLLTNNQSVLEFEYYDERYIRYFKEPSDINWEWIKEDTIIDYGYDGRYSPTNLLENIRIRINNNSK